MDSTFDPKPSRHPITRANSASLGNDDRLEPPIRYAFERYNQRLVPATGHAGWSRCAPKSLRYLRTPIAICRGRRHFTCKCGVGTDYSSFSKSGGANRSPLILGHFQVMAQNVHVAHSSDK